jgi:hypothetical protein
MKLMAFALVFAGIVRAAQAQAYTASEDRSRFVEQPYKTALSGMKPPAAYIEMAKKAIKAKDSEIIFRQFSEPIVTHRIYRNAPSSDRDIIAVQFVYEGSISGGGFSAPMGLCTSARSRCR